MKSNWVPATTSKSTQSVCVSGEDRMIEYMQDRMPPQKAYGLVKGGEKWAFAGFMYAFLSLVFFPLLGPQIVLIGFFAVSLMWINSVTKEAVYTLESPHAIYEVESYQQEHRVVLELVEYQPDHSLGEYTSKVLQTKSFQVEEEIALFEVAEEWKHLAEKLQKQAEEKWSKKQEAIDMAKEIQKRISAN